MQLKIIPGTLIAALMLLHMPAAGQHYGYRAGIPPVAAEGLYAIPITPDVTARSQPDSRDLRIRDADGQEAAYLIKGGVVRLEPGSFLPFEWISRGKGADGNTHLILKNSDARPLSEIVLRLRNTAAVRKASVSGSNDGQRFFSLRDSVLLDAAQTTGGDTATCFISLPAATYPYIQLSIFDKDLLPLDVLEAGRSRAGVQVRKTGYTAVPSPAITQRDSSDHHSYIRLRFDAPYRVERIALRFGGARLFRREAVLYADDGTETRFSIEQGVPAVLRGEWHTSVLQLVVDNEDNAPLRLESAGAEQSTQRLIAFLESGKSYSLCYGDSSLAAPVYDLRHYSDSIGRLDVPELQPAAATRVLLSGPPVVVKPLIGKGTMWAIILLVLAGLAAATVALMRQIKRREV